MMEVMHHHQMKQHVPGHYVNGYNEIHGPSQQLTNGDSGGIDSGYPDDDSSPEPATANNGKIVLSSPSATGDSNEDYASSNSEDSFSMNGREMAIDVPEGFEPHRKSPPRLPDSYFDNQRKVKKKTKLAEAPNHTGASHNERSQSSIREKQRRLKEEQHKRELKQTQQNFLRTSLRDSEKMRALKKHKAATIAAAAAPPKAHSPPPTTESASSPTDIIGIVNAAFDDVSSHNDSARSSGNSSRKDMGESKSSRENDLVAGLTSPLDINEILRILRNVNESLASPEDRKCVSQLSQIFHDQKFSNAIKVHKQIVESKILPRGGGRGGPSASSSGLTGGSGAQPQQEQEKTEPLCTNATSILEAVLEALGGSRYTEKHILELQLVLRQPYFLWLVSTHDQVAEHELGTVALLSPDELVNENYDSDLLLAKQKEYGNSTLKLVCLTKNPENPLGATIRNEGDSVMVARIVRGGAVELSGDMVEGDEILEINNEVVRGLNINDVCDIMATMSGPMKFLVFPIERSNYVRERLALHPTPLHYRTHFSYDPEDDLYIPCRELGISFERGDIVHVTDHSDPNWWQAYRDGEEGQLSGIIPSKAFQEQLEAMRLAMAGGGTSKDGSGRQANADDDDGKISCGCSRKSKNKAGTSAGKSKAGGSSGSVNKKNGLYAGGLAGEEEEEVLTYEEVGLYYPQPNRKRPVVLIGPPHIGRHELRQRLIESNPERFAAAIPHTSRPRNDGELDGKDYFFVPRDQFEHDINMHRFAEYGEYQKNLYGTSLESIRQVVQAGKICVLSLHPQSLRILKSSDLKPFIVFIAPPNLEALKRLHEKMKLDTRLTEEDLKNLIEKGRELDEKFAHYFDTFLVNTDLDKVYSELLAEINSLDVKPQWVPSHWLNN